MPYPIYRSASAPEPGMPYPIYRPTSAPQPDMPYPIYRPGGHLRAGADIQHAISDISGRCLPERAADSAPMPARPAHESVEDGPGLSTYEGPRRAPTPRTPLAPCPG